MDTETIETETISTFESKSDAELMEAVVRRESDAIQEIYRRYESALRAVVQNVLHEDGETDDALNDVFLQLWDHADPFIAGKGLHGVIGNLPTPQQEVVHLAFFEGLSQREIAARKSIALGTVKTRLQLAQKKLFNQLAQVQNMI